MATKQERKSAANDIQNLFDPQGYQNILKAFASSNERAMHVIVEAGNRSADIFSDSMKEALGNMRDVAQVRDEVADYGKAYSDFTQKQMDLFMRTAQSFAGVAQDAGQQSAELTSEAGREIGEKVAANAEGAADKAGSAAKKAAA